MATKWFASITILQDRNKTSFTFSITPELIRHDVTMPFFIEVDEIYNLLHAWHRLYITSTMPLKP